MSNYIFLCFGGIIVLGWIDEEFCRATIFFDSGFISLGIQDVSSELKVLYRNQDPWEG